jgi:hypothetical protein
MSRIGERSVRRLRLRFASDTDALQLSSDLQQRGRALSDLHLRDAHVTRESRSYIARATALLTALNFQTLCPNYRNEIAQFVFDVARHSDGMCDFLA